MMRLFFAAILVASLTNCTALDKISAVSSVGIEKVKTKVDETVASRKPYTVEKLVLPIVDILDGDTIKTLYNVLPEPLNKISIRLDGVDTPEKTWRGKCDAERAYGEKASKFVKDIIGDTKFMTVTNFSYGKFAGRIMGDITVNGINIKEKLLEAGYAVEYHGEKKMDWCLYLKK
jgi:endonuclease YncB( thermonuclease family)